MAKYKRGARSAAIREYLGSHPGAGIKDVIEGLKSSGMRVSVGLVSNIKYGQTGKKKGGRRRKLAGRRGTAITAAQLIEAKRMADSLGGVAQAQMALETLRKLQ
ncbi:MAG: hypothetical protein ACT4QC_11240 [Planctomycetaceae bacterium]